MRIQNSDFRFMRRGLHLIELLLSYRLAICSNRIQMRLSSLIVKVISQQLLIANYFNPT